ncbi:MAG TPA: hypothetical protein VM325_14145 [Alphaproteobacteria bacterium]|nr:hypothetical protein [Alphaproteobacteria bacterium]
MIYIYDAGTQTRKVRFLAWLAIAAFLGSVWGGVDVLADGEAAAAAVIFSLGGAFLAGMLVFLDHYACGLSVDFEAGVVEVDTPRLLGERSRSYPLADLVGAAYEADDTTTIKHHVRAPYVKLRIDGRRWPFVIDMQGTIVDEACFERLLSGLGSPGMA